MATFPTADADIRALKARILRALAAAAHPKEAIGTVALNNKLTVDDVKSLVVNHGWPDQREMRRHAFELEGGTLPADSPVLAPRPAAPPAPRRDAVEQLLTDAEASKKARTRNLAAKVRDQLAELRELVTTEQKDTEQAAAEAERLAKLQSEVAELELELIQKKAALKGKTPPAATGDAKAIRAWARDNNVDCPARGRIPREVSEGYARATGGAL